MISQLQRGLSIGNGDQRFAMAAQNPGGVLLMLVDSMAYLFDRCSYDLVSKFFGVMEFDDSAIKADHSGQPICCEES